MKRHLQNIALVVGALVLSAVGAEGIGSCGHDDDGDDDDDDHGHGHGGHDD